MRTRDRSRDGHLSQRKAWEWQPPAAPTFADLRSGRDGRQRWIRYWIRDTARNALDLAMHHGFRLLPSGRASDAGAAAARLMAPRLHRPSMERALDNLRLILPDRTEDERLAIRARHFENVGRVMAEFSIIDRLIPEGRVAIRGADPLRDAVGTGPVVLVCMHTGNWEVMAPALQSLGIRYAPIYMPPTNRLHHAIALKAREAFGATYVPPGRAGVRPAIRLLQEGQIVSIFCDESFAGRAQAPFFHRPPHLDGNLSTAIRLARLTGARLVPAHCVRLADCRFRVNFLPPITLAAHDDPGPHLLDDVTMLNGVIEPIVRAHLDQWYFLNSRM